MPPDDDAPALDALAAALTGDAGAADGARRCAKYLLTRVEGACVVQFTLATPLAPPSPSVLTWPRPPRGGGRPAAPGGSTTAAEAVTRDLKKAVTWAPACGPSPPHADWRGLAASHAAAAFATVPVALPGRPPSALTVGGAAAMDVAAAAGAAARVAALLAPYLALSTARARLDATQSLLTDAMPPSVVANMVERAAMGPAVLGGDGGGGGG